MSVVPGPDADRRERWPPDGPGTFDSIMKESDIPCSDCGTDLEERTVHVRDLPFTTDAQLSVDVAVCPGCGARYYPRETLDRLGATGVRSGRRGDI